MLPDAYLSHAIPGRLRVKIPSKKGDSCYFDDVHKQMSGYEGIASVAVNALTGSVLVIHTVDFRKIAAYAERNNLFRMEDVKPFEKQTYISRKVSETFKDVNSRVIVSTKGFANVPDLVLLALVGLSAIQISRGNFTAPAWYTALWYALNIFLKAQAKEV
jgi:hypothetical protein